jgi:hypothetical protein
MDVKDWVCNMHLLEKRVEQPGACFQVQVQPFETRVVVCQERLLGQGCLWWDQIVKTWACVVSSIEDVPGEDGFDGKSAEVCAVRLVQWATMKGRRLAVCDCRDPRCGLHAIGVVNDGPSMLDLLRLLLLLLLDKRLDLIEALNNH